MISAGGHAPKPWPISTEHGLVGSRLQQIANKTSRESVPTEAQTLRCGTGAPGSRMSGGKGIPGHEVIDGQPAVARAVQGILSRLQRSARALRALATCSGLCPLVAGSFNPRLGRGGLYIGGEGHHACSPSQEALPNDRTAPEAPRRPLALPLRPPRVAR